jgi:DNA-binding FadR family transcriptional regulator
MKSTTRTRSNAAPRRRHESSTRPAADTFVDRITRTIAIEILRGDVAPGVRLPTVRALAQIHGVHVATIQRVVAQLEAMGLVEAVHGSGVRALDPRRNGDLSLLPLWLAAFAADRDAAARLLDQFLEVRRILAVSLFERFADRSAAAQAAIQSWKNALEEAAPKGVDAVAAADASSTRGLVEATGQIAILAIFNTLERAVTASPALRQAMYGAPAENIAGLKAITRALADGERLDPKKVGRLLERIDARTVARFRESA